MVGHICISLSHCMLLGEVSNFGVWTEDGPAGCSALISGVRWQQGGSYGNGDCARSSGQEYPL